MVSGKVSGLSGRRGRETGGGGYGPVEKGSEQGEKNDAKAEDQIVVSVPSLVGTPAKYQGIEGQLVF